MRSCTVFLAAFLVITGAGQAQAVVSDFDSIVDGLEGWIGNGGLATHVPSGGNPGGYLELADRAPGHMYIQPFGTSATDDFLDDLTGFDGGSFSFDAKFISGNTPAFSGFGEVTLFNGASSVTLDFAPTGDPISTWTTYSMPFTASTWNVSQSEWTTLLTDVTDLRIRLEFANSTEEVGVDNITLASKQGGAIPEPSSLAIWGLLVAVCVGVSLRRRKKR